MKSLTKFVIVSFFGTMLLGVIQNANASGLESVLAVSECKPHQKIETTFGGAMDRGSYTNFRFAVKTCDYNFMKQSYEVRVKTTVVDLGFFEDNDHLQVTANLKERCESLRDEALGEVVNRDETPCRARK